MKEKFSQKKGKMIFKVKFNLSSRICLFSESQKSLSSNNKVCNKASFARFTHPHNCISA